MDILLRDSEGVLRFPNNVRVSEEAVKEIIEVMWTKNSTNFKLKQLEVSFSDYDVVNGIKNRGVSKKWTDDEEKYVLNHPDDDNGEIGKALNRTFMSVLMHKPDLLDDYSDWILRHPEEIKGLSREQIVDAFFEDDE